jgi:hypothetical protein
LYYPSYTNVVVVNEVEPDQDEQDDQRSDLYNADTVGEVSVSFSELGPTGPNVDKINKIVSENNYWTAFTNGEYTYLILIDQIPQTSAEEREKFITKMRSTIDGNPELTISQHNGDFRNRTLVNYVREREVIAEHILDYNPT